MLVWLICFLVIGAVAFVGYFQGAVRVAVSLVGLIISGVLAIPLAPVAKPVLGLVGIEHPLARSALAPILAFLVILTVVKIIAHSVNHKINHHFEFKASEGGRIRWNRFQPRVGLSLGVFNGTIYFLLLMLPIYLSGYATYQIASDGESSSIKFINKVREQLHSTKIDKVLAAYDPAPKEYYEAADIIGLVLKNPLLQNRLHRYPSFLSLSERQEFQDLANDVEVQNMWQSGLSVGDFFNHPRVQAITTNSALIGEIQTTLLPDLKDLGQFLRSGKSEKYDGEPILGRWEINLGATINLAKNERSVLPLPERRALQSKLAPLRGTTLIATSDNKTFLKAGPNLPNSDGQSRMIAQGSWSKEKGTYEITLENQTSEINIKENRLIAFRDGLKLAFDKER